MRFHFNIIFIFALYPFSLAAEETPQTYTLEEAKAHYTFETFKHITWPNEDSIKHFTLGVMTKNKKLMEALAEISNKEIKGKNIIVQHLDIKKPQQKNYSAILIGNKETALTLQVQTQFPQALIINDGEIDKNTLMVALVTHDKEMRIELNRDNLRQRGFNVSNSFLNFGGTKQDLNQQLKEKEQYLNQLMVDAQRKENELIETNQALQLINNKLITNENALQQSQHKLDALQRERDSAIIEKNNNKTLLEQQKKLITEKQIELELHQQNLVKLHQEIKQNQALQQQQVIKLKQQNTIIDKKEKTISEQRLFIYIATGVTFIVLLLIYFIMRLNRISNKDNQELVVLNEQLYELATTDSMTKLYNRLHFLESAQIQIKQLHRNKLEGAILMMDIDHFKKVNDTYGHATGDEAIISIANVFRDNLREYDVVGRLGGEEYGMLLSNCPIKKAIEIAERLREKIENLPIVFNDKKINLTISIGVSEIKFLDDNINQALQRADKALYQAKNTGRNKVVFG